MRLDRRAFVAALLAGGVGGATLTEARSFLDRFAPLSGDVCDAATRSVGEQGVESDLFHTRMDFRSGAAANWDAVRDTPAGDAMEAYVAGVEAYRTTGDPQGRNRDPPEFDPREEN